MHRLLRVISDEGTLPFLSIEIQIQADEERLSHPGPVYFGRRGVYMYGGMRITTGRAYTA